MAVTNENDTTIDAATIGDVLKLSLTVEPKDTYAILPRNCFAINLESGERYSLTDSAGCAIDTALFPEWSRIRPYITQVKIKLLKNIKFINFRPCFEHLNGQILLLYVLNVTAPHALKLVQQ